MRGQKEVIFCRYRPTWMELGAEKPLKNYSVTTIS